MVIQLHLRRPNVVGRADARETAAFKPIHTTAVHVLG